MILWPLSILSTFGLASSLSLANLASEEQSNGNNILPLTLEKVSLSLAVSFQHVFSLRSLLINSFSLILSQGFWSGKVKAGAEELNLVVDTGSYALLINKGQYQPSKHFVHTEKGSYIQFSGGNQNGTENIDVSDSLLRNHRIMEIS